MRLDLEQASSEAPRRGFTLVELLISIGVITVLMGIAAAAFFGRKADMRVERAKTDLQVIQVALEAYRSRFGDYPRLPSSYDGLEPVVSPEAYLLNALNGQIGPGHDPVSDIPSLLDNGLLEFAGPTLPLSGLVSNWIVDPWEQAYVYDYRPADAGWKAFGYRLYSIGPDGVEGTEDDVFAR